jgi:hypothetical protein
MNGAIGSYVYAAGLGVQTAQAHLNEIFCFEFQTPGGWTRMLDHLPGRSVDTMLNRSGGFWSRECFQALYVACWIHHPVEKGSYMIQLSPTHYANVKDAYLSLLRSGALQARISSHLSKKGASAHQGWSFLKGYEELLIQIEGEETSAPYLFLKCEGHAIEGLISKSTVMHGASWVKKTFTGKGMTASKSLQEWATFSSTVEDRAAENYSPAYEKLLKQLGLSGTKVSVEQVLEALLLKAGLTPRLPDSAKRDSHSLGQSMIGFQGYIALFKRQKAVLKGNGVDFDDKAEQELTGLAARMMAGPTPHAVQIYNEIRVTPVEVDVSLAAFRGFVV